MVTIFVSTRIISSSFVFPAGVGVGEGWRPPPMRTGGPPGVAGRFGWFWMVGGVGLDATRGRVDLLFCANTPKLAKTMADATAPNFFIERGPLRAEKYFWGKRSFD
jgi:hypothetical protein